MTKLLVLLAALVIAVPTAGLAQAPSLGLKGGLNLADFGGRRIVTSNHLVGVTLGAFASFPITSTVVLQLEVVFSQKSASSAAYDYHDMPADGDVPPIDHYLSEKTTHSYLEIPGLLAVSTAPSDAIVRRTSLRVHRPRS